MYQGGYTGRTLRFKPTGQTANGKELPPKVAKDCIADVGFGVKCFFFEHTAGINPLNPDQLRIASDLFSDATIPPASQMAGAAKSSLIHPVGVVLSDGYFPLELKYAGCAVRGVKTKGLNDAPCYTVEDHNRGYAFQQVRGMPISLRWIDLLPKSKKFSSRC
jgi:aldehyde:ferredoxin oxidoreductase